MVSLKKVESQLKQIGFNPHAWGRGEVKELCRILADDEVIKQCANGYYQGGFAMLVATDQRLLMVDRKIMFLNMEAIWYDKIGQVDYFHRLLNATLIVSSPNKELSFTSLDHGRLRQILAYSQEKMIAAKEGEGAAEVERKAEKRMEEAAPVAENRLSAFLSERVDPKPEPRTTLPPVADFPQPSSSDRLKVYTAARLPFSKRRYFARPDY